MRLAFAEPMRALLQDLRYASRLWIRSVGFTVVAVITLALGIGATTAIFTVVHAVLIAQLPYREPDRVIVLSEEWVRRPGVANVIGPFNLVRWRERQQTLEQIAGYFDGRVNLVGGGAPEEVIWQSVTTNFFDTLGASPLLGRGFVDAEGADGANNVAVISHGLWLRRFGGEASVIGRTIQINGRAAQVIGVMPSRFSFLVRDTSLVGKPADIWMPFALAGGYREWQGRYMGAVGRLRANVSIEESRAEMRAIASALEQEFPQFDTGWSIMVRPVRDALTGSIRPALVVLTGAVGFVLLIACANVANLLLARGATRLREIALRRALGASRLRVAAQLLTETLALALAGGAAGLLVAQWGLAALLALSPPGLADIGAVQLNKTALAFTLILSILTAVASGLAFAIEGSRTDVHDVLADGARQVGVSLRHRRLRSAFVVAEIALAVVLLVGAGLMMRSFARVRAINPGFDAENVLTARVGLPTRKYSTPEVRLGFFREAVDRLRALPGVESAGAVSFLPLAGLGAATSFTIVGQPAPAPGQAPVADVRVCDNGYFEAMRIALVGGRTFSDREMRERANVVIVNETLARQHFPGQDPIGQRLDISMGAPPRVATEIIGVVADVRLAEIQVAARPTTYWPHPQLDYPAMTLTVRTASSPLTLAPALERLIQELDADQPVSEVRSMDEWLGLAVAQRRFNTFLLLTFAGVAVVLAAVGIYGVISYSVGQRTPEIGLRLALGASERDILTMVVGNASKLAFTGLAIGLGLALILNRTMSGLLYETSGTDPVTIGVVILLLGPVAILASYLPARRASRVEPIQALRYQ
jgi:putative ABC transport system permease protein